MQCNLFRYSYVLSQIINVHDGNPCYLVVSNYWKMNWNLTLDRTTMRLSSRNKPNL